MLKCLLPPPPLFSLQRTHRLPKEMTPVEPSAFAAQLIARLEKLKREQDTMSSLEERLQQIQEVRTREAARSSVTHGRRRDSHELRTLPTS